MVEHILCATYWWFLLLEGLQGCCDLGHFDTLLLPVSKYIFFQHSYGNCRTSRGHSVQFPHSASVLMWKICKMQFRNNNCCSWTSLKQQFASMPVWVRWLMRSQLEGQRCTISFYLQKREIDLDPFGKTLSLCNQMAIATGYSRAGFE